MTKSKKFLAAIITLACVASAYGFYKMNGGDPVVAILFGVGILGIMASFLRK